MMFFSPLLTSCCACRDLCHRSSMWSSPRPEARAVVPSPQVCLIVLTSPLILRCVCCHIVSCLHAQLWPPLHAGALSSLHHSNPCLLNRFASLSVCSYAQPPSYRVSSCVVALRCASRRNAQWLRRIRAETSCTCITLETASIPSRLHCLGSSASCMTLDHWSIYSISLSFCLCRWIRILLDSRAIGFVRSDHDHSNFVPIDSSYYYCLRNNKLKMPPRKKKGLICSYVYDLLLSVACCILTS